jgi:aminomethyltransferase
MSSRSSSRTARRFCCLEAGYTGEFGFELFMAPDKVNDFWYMIGEAGQDYGLIPCGLAARDSLRAGAGLPLSHQDIGDWPFINNPWLFALPFNRERAGFTSRLSAMAFWIWLNPRITP